MFETLTPARLEEASEMMSRSFIKINSIWVKLEVKYEEAFKYNLYRLRKGMESEVTFVSVLLSRSTSTRRQTRSSGSTLPTISMIT